MIPKEPPPTLTFDLSVDPDTDVFPMRVIIGNTKYEFNARVIERRLTKKVERFKVQIVGQVTMKEA